MTSLSNLNKSICYSVGAIDRCPDAGKSWRDNLDTWLPTMGITHINPHNKPFQVPQEDDASRQEVNLWKKEGKFTKIRSKYRYIRSTDLRCVDLCHFIIARIDVDVHICGTYEEIFTANRSKKPILCHIVGGIEHTPNWLIYTLPEWSFFNTIEEIHQYLNMVHTTPVSKLDDRWVLYK